MLLKKLVHTAVPKQHPGNLPQGQPRVPASDCLSKKTFCSICSTPFAFFLLMVSRAPSGGETGITVFDVRKRPPVTALSLLIRSPSLDGGSYLLQQQRFSVTNTRVVEGGFLRKRYLFT